MNYRNFKNYDKKPSALGFGCMRLPTTDGVASSENIDEEESIKMIRYAIDNGLNFIDTAYPYHGQKSELLVAKALKDGYREKVMLSTKCPMWFVKTEDDFDKYLNEQLEKLETDYLDYYFLHALNEGAWKTICDLKILEKAEQAKKEGKIKNIGFSFHDKLEAFETILNGYDKWDFCMLQLNYVDTEYQGGLTGIKQAYAKGLDIFVMEPLQGGKIANLPPKFKKVFDESGFEKSEVEWAFDFIWNMPEISIVLSGMSTMEQVKTGIEYASRSSVGMLSKKEVDAIENVGQMFRDLKAVPCTKCSYCMPCHKGVNIPNVLTLYNEVNLYDDFEKTKNTYDKMNDANKAHNCIDCKICEKMCPQKIKIGTEMQKIKDFFK